MIDILLAIKVVDDALATVGIYPQSTITVDKDGKETEVKKRTTWQDGWNAAIMHISDEIFKQFDVMREGIDEDLALLCVAGVGWLDGDKLQLNMNDTFHFACADMETVSKEEIKEVARLFRTYGDRGPVYWVAQKRGYDPEILQHKEAVKEVRKYEGIR